MRLFMIFPVLLSVLCLAVPAQDAGMERERDEALFKEQALFDLKKKALQEEMDRFETEKQAWQQKKEAELLLRNLEDAGAPDLDRESRKRMVMSNILSGAFRDFLKEEGRTDGTVRQVLIQLQADDNGRVKTVIFQRSEVPYETETKIKNIVRKLDLSPLEEDANNLTWRFPLLLKK